MTTDLGIKVLFDLRSEIEAARLIGRPKGIEIVSTPVFPIADIRAHPEMVSQQLRWYTAPDIPADAGFSQGYVDCYRDIALHGVKAFRTIFEHIRDHPERPFVYHCTAGKDRTGVLTALIQKICGVDDEAVAWDYSLTVPGMGKWEEKVEAEMVGDSMMPIREHEGMTKEEAKRVCGSRSANMKAWLEKVLEKEFGAGKVRAFRLSSPGSPKPRAWEKISDLVDEVSNARVWGGVHYRNSTVVGTAMGRKIGELVWETQLKPLK